ncbi:MAG: hydroxyacid dehydrogenase [Pseudomonadota bacterium]
MSNSTLSPAQPWIALAATEDLPIASAEVETVANGVASVRTIALPYKPLDAGEEAQWAQALAGAGGILLRSGFMTDSLLAQLPDLKVIGVHGAGVDPVDVDACRRRGVVVTNTPGANAVAVAELTIGLMLSLLRDIPGASDRVRRDNAWDLARHTGGELQHRTLGLLGFGQIGRRVAGIANAFGMAIIAHDPGVGEDAMREHQVRAVDFEGLCREADIVSLHAPALPQTQHIINESSIAAMKRGVYIINCARGSLVNEEALALALQSGQAGGAALDVLNGEPPDPNSPLFAAPNIILTPHMAGSTNECLRTIAAVAGADIVRVLRGEAPHHRVV